MAAAQQVPAQQGMGMLPPPGMPFGMPGTMPPGADATRGPPFDS